MAARVSVTMTAHKLSMKLIVYNVVLCLKSDFKMRIDATTYALAVAGVNLPELYIKAKTEGKNLPNSHKVKELQSIVEFNDFKHRGHFGVSTTQWLKQYLGAKCKYYFSWNDMMTFFFAPFK